MNFIYITKIKLCHEPYLKMIFSLTNCTYFSQICFLRLKLYNKVIAKWTDWKRKWPTVYKESGQESQKGEGWFVFVWQKDLGWLQTRIDMAKAPMGWDLWENRILSSKTFFFFFDKGRPSIENIFIAY